MAGICENITSRQNKTISYIASLSDKKVRKKEGKFCLDGVKLTCEAVIKGMSVSYIVILESEKENVIDKAKKLYGVDILSLDTKIIFTPMSCFERLTDEKSPEGMICVASKPTDIHRVFKSGEIPNVDKCENILMLEGVRDPQNVGAIMRTGAAFGVDRVIMSSDCADIYNSKTLRASMGNLLGLKIDIVDDIVSVIEYMKMQKIAVYAAALCDNSLKLGKSELSKPCTVIIGNEGHGLTKEVIDACSDTVYIPMSNGVESLNASVAASVLLWEFFGKQNI